MDMPGSRSATSAAAAAAAAHAAEEAEDREDVMDEVDVLVTLFERPLEDSYDLIASTLILASFYIGKASCDKILMLAPSVLMNIYPIFFKTPWTRPGQGAAWDRISRSGIMNASTAGSQRTRRRMRRRRRPLVAFVPLVCHALVLWMGVMGMVVQIAGMAGRGGGGGGGLSSGGVQFSVEHADVKTFFHVRFHAQDGGDAVRGRECEEAVRQQHRQGRVDLAVMVR
ncbi:hypothetical protein HDU67_007254 [Dinochytrium kinnereticum]|nr:hypothetical protein HDU67_007254 [Dinochytrium kinnereticum]